MERLFWHQSEFPSQAMWLDLLPVEKSYFPHLVGEGVARVLDLRYEPTHEHGRDLRQVFHSLLGQVSGVESEWFFSFAGSFTEGCNLSLLKFLSAHQYEVAFNLPETCKLALDTPMPFIEISFVCSLELLKEFMADESLHFAWDFRLGGWLVKAGDRSSLLKKPKFRGEFYYPSTAVELGFCSSEDWDCIQFFSASEERLRNIQNKWMLNHKLAKHS